MSTVVFTFHVSHGPSICSPGLISFGSPLGLNNIEAESSTNDGDVFDSLTGSVPEVVGGDGSVIRAVDGLLYATRDAL